ncbi:hypothetical protein [Bradyrhizobium sp. WSM3983]|uniref:hypothetical protein n=1 Tax=Bradyrhizobium sp. WSM3983 TaxID=1038867 RepID=UPI0018DBD13A|nr:hypothetical protein [Bradyrhizobium sp. WSM3983]
MPVVLGRLIDQPHLGIFIHAVQLPAACQTTALYEARDLDQDRVLHFDRLVESPVMGEQTAD